MNANTKSHPHASSEATSLPCVNTEDDLNDLLGAVLPEDKLSRQFFLSSRLALAWITHSTKDIINGMWLGRARELLITAASGSPRLPLELEADCAYKWALSLEAIEDKAGLGPEGAAARVGLNCLPGYQEGAKIQSDSTLQQLGYLQMMLFPFYSLAWRAAEIYQELPEPEWRATERKVLKSSIFPMFEAPGCDWSEDEKERWLAELQRDQIGCSIAKGKGKGTGRESVRRL